MVSLAACRAGFPAVDASPKDTGSTDALNFSSAAGEAAGATTGQGETHVAQEGKLLFDFQGQDEAARWVRVNDGVMGGLSQSEMRFTTPRKTNT